MAKGGARKKTKWVSLSLANANATVPPAENEVDGSRKSIRPTTFVTNKSAEIESRDFHHSTSERRPVSGSDGARPRRNQTDGNSSLYTNGHHIHRSYTTKSLHNNYFSGSGSGSKSHLTSHNSSDSYTNSSNSSKYAINAKNESYGTATINEDEYTKITTPRQDVLFKKGYLTRPKRQTGSATMMTNETGNFTASSSVNGTTDGSDAATGSGSASTAESVTSDSTYLTDAHFMEYPAAYPYFGYFDQSGVLVMNGFAVDNNGFSYMNGGQTYIYPPNYHCQQSPVDSSNIHTTDINVVATDKTHHLPDSDVAEGVPEEVTNLLPAEVDALVQGEQTDEIGKLFLSEHEIIKQQDGENIQNTVDFDQHVPQQEQQLQYAADGYDCSQFYNAFYYPGCVIAPIPVFPNGMYIDQYEEENDRQAAFRKRKKRYRGWEEHPAGTSLEGMPGFAYTDPTYFYGHEVVPSEQTEMTELDTCLENTVEPLSSHPFLESEQSLPSNDLPVCVPEERSLQPTTSNSSVSEKPKSGSHIKQQSSIVLGTKPKSQKLHKKALIESTRAFAEQNIDLRPACLSKANEIHHSEANAWRTVRHGKEIADIDDKELRNVNTKTVTKMDAIQETPETHFNEETSLSTREMCTNMPTVALTTAITINDDKNIRKDFNSKKTKKQSKGKGKKIRKTNLLQQQKGFKVIEPDFGKIVSSKCDDEQLQFENTEDQKEYEECENTIVLEDVDNFNSTPEISTYINEKFEVETNESTPDFRKDNPYEDDLHEVFSNVHINDIPTQEEQIIGEVKDESSEEFLTKQSISEVCDLAVNRVDNVINNVPLNISCHEESLIVCPSKNIDVKHDVQDDGCTTANNIVTSDRLVSSIYEDDTVEDDDQISRHFSGEEYSENLDSGLQSPAAFVVTTNEARKSSSSSYNSREMHVTDAVTKWLSETLSDKRLEEMFVLPNDPSLLQRINQFNVMGLDILSDSYSSSSGDEAEDADSDYMSDVQGRKHPNSSIESNQKTEIQKDQLNKQTANGHVPVTSHHSNHKQKRCIIM